MKSEDTKTDDNVVAPGDTPPWPYINEDGKKGDSSKLAEAAWAQSFGSMTAFNQLAADHEAGRVNLLDLKESQPDPAQVQRRAAPSAPASALDQGMVGTNEYIADNARRSEADRVVHGQNIQGDAPVARAEAERDEARASRSVAAVDAAIAASAHAQAEVVREARGRAAPEVAAARASTARASANEPVGKTTDGKRTD